LQDADPAVRFVAVQWIGEESLTEYREPLTEMLRTRADSRLLFESCLAALERLDGVNRKPTDEVPGEQYVLRLLVDEKTPAEVRRRALRTLRPEHPGLTLELLKTQLASDEAGLRIEAIRSLRDHPSRGKVELMLEISRDAARSDRERAEAVMGLDAGDQDHPQARQRLLELAVTGDGVVAIEALRSLRGASLEAAEWKRLTDASPTRSVAWRELLDRVRAPRPAAAETSRTEFWFAKLDGDADPEAGERIFFHPRATGCYRCHEFDGRGAGIGPELTRATRTLEKRRLVESLVEPSREVAPQFVPWSIETHGGEVFTGLLFAEEVDGTQRYIDSSTRVRRIKPAEIERRQPLERSIMPDGLPNLLTEQEFRDLVAFLRQAR
jgi:putative heme-binding domain-containing protein